LVGNILFVSEPESDPLPPTIMVLITDNSVKLSIGDTMPNFALPATDGMTVESNMIKDPVLVVVFTCNHCPYAKAYEDRLIDIANKFDEAGAQFVLINSNDATSYPDDSFENMKVLHDTKSFPFPYCFDESQEIAQAFGALCTPHCFVFDSQRHLKYKGRIDDSWDDPDAVTEHNLADAIASLVDGKEPQNHEENAIGCSIKWK
jgi:peroxiredoxin